MGIFSRIFGKTEDKPSDIEKRFTQTLEKLDKFKRTAYVPNVKQNGNAFSVKSKIGGFPFLRDENDWPVCPNCKNHMQLFLQLNLNDLPDKKEDGLIQFFYCTNSEPLCETDLEAFFHFSKGVHCRRFIPSGESVQIEPKLADIFDEKLIVGWTPKDDYPHYEDHDSLGIEVDDDVFELMDERQKGIPLDKDKLFGWPFWVQGAEYPHDRQTNSKMDLLFQFDSEINLPYMFGDAGIGHLTVSPDNADEMTFGWACY
jgi:uncharacterized protein YwqG